MKTLTVDVLGTAVGIAAPAPDLVQLRGFLADLEPAPSADRELALMPSGNGFDLVDGGRVVSRGVAPDVGVATVVWRLNAIAAESTFHVLLHGACVVGPRDGAVLLVGGSGAGKSTLTAACVGAGLAYLSDEAAAIDRRTGLVSPYARPLSIDGGRLVAASSLGSVASAAATPVALVFPRYEPAAEASVVRLDPDWALAALVSHATNLAELGGTGLAWLAGLALACPAYQLTHADAGQATTAIAGTADRAGRPIEPAAVLGAITVDTTTVAVGDSLAVLHKPSGRIHVLNPAAADVWRRAAVDPTAGGQPDRSATAATIVQLTRRGLLVAPPGP
jgi:hypothetical protein